jgi:1-acyl-sn-glycerol-3-phosphate acyltransferase
MNLLKSIIAWLIAICFIAVTFPLTLILWLITLPFDKRRKIIHFFLTYQSLLLAFLIPIWTIRIEGREKAIKGTTYVIISNHQSILDILLINCLRYKYKWISKIENVKVPVIGWYLKMADYIIFNREDEDSKIEMLERSYIYLRNGISLMMFPEGTRSLTSEIGYFKRGAFQLAIQAKVPILPVLLDGTGGILPKHGLIFRSGHHIRIKVLEPVTPAMFGTENPEDLARRMGELMTSRLKELRSTNNT